MVLEVTNEEGRKQYRREGYKERIAAAGERCGARRATGAGAAFRDWEAGTSWWDLVPTRGVEAGEGATSEEGETHVGTSRVEAETRGSLRPSNPRPVTHRASGGTLRYGDAWGVWKRGEDPWARQVAMRQRRNAEGLPPLPETVAAAAATAAAAAARAEAVAAAGGRATAMVTRERTARAAAAAAAFEAAALARAGLDNPAVPTRYSSTYFAHIFAGGYGASYYGYIWSEVLDADTVEWFKENGGLTRANGDRFREYILGSAIGLVLPIAIVTALFEWFLAWL